MVGQLPPLVQNSPKIFNWVQVWGILRPNPFPPVVWNIFFQPFVIYFCHVTVGPILHKNSLDISGEICLSEM